MDARRSQSSTDGRRRRLLATQDTQDLLAEFEALAPQTVATPAPTVTVPAADRPILQRVISGQLWKHSTLIAIAVLLTASAIWIENRPPLALQELVADTDLRISHGLAGVLLILAGQISLLIGWIRSHSTVDFSGRYRCWKWLAGCLIVAGLLWITNLQDSLPQLARLIAEPVIGSIGAARRTLVVVPVAAVSIWVLSRVIPDMGRNRISQIVFTTGILLTAARLLPAETSIAGWLTLPALNGILLSATVLMMSALLLHARFVLYISKDPPERRARRTAAAPPAEKKQENSQPATAEKGSRQSKLAKKRTQKTAELEPTESPQPEPTSPEPTSPEPDEVTVDDSPDVVAASWPDDGEENNSGKSKGRKRRRNKRRDRRAA